MVKDRPLAIAPRRILLRASDWLNLIFRVGLSMVMGGLIGFEHQALPPGLASLGRG